MLWGFKNSNQNNIIYILIKIVNILKTYKLSWNCWHLLDGRLMQSTCSFYVCFILQMYVHRGFIHTDVCSTKFHTLWCMFWVYRNPLLNFFPLFNTWGEIKQCWGLEREHQICYLTHCIVYIAAVYIVLCTASLVWCRILTLSTMAQSSAAHFEIN